MSDNSFHSRPRISPQEMHLTGRCKFLQRTEQFPLAVSAFTVGIVAINGVDHVVMVKNSEERRPDGSIKPAGWGLPGGGVEINEDIAAAAVREVKSETGFTVTDPVWKRYDHNLLFSQGGDLRYTPCHLIEKSGVDVRDAERQTLVHTFKADLVWEGPAAEAFELVRALTSNELIVHLDPEMGARLGIAEACKAADGSQEIVALGLFPVEEILETGWLQGDFYRSHLTRLRKALDVELVVR